MPSLKNMAYPCYSPSPPPPPPSPPPCNPPSPPPPSPPPCNPPSPPPPCKEPIPPPPQPHPRSTHCHQKHCGHHHHHPPNGACPPVSPPSHPPTIAPMSPPSGSGGNDRTTIIAVCASLGGFFFLTFLAAGLFRLGMTKKLIRVPAVATQAIGACLGAEKDPAPDGGGGEISEGSEGEPFDKPFNLSTVRNHGFQRRLGDGDQGSSRQPMGRSSATVPASLSHRPASEGPPTSKVRSGSPAGKQAWEPMKDVMNPSDPGTLGDYTSDQLLDLGAGDLVSPEVEKRWFDENGKSKEELAQKPSRRDFSKEKYNRDDKHRRRPLESAPRKNQMENPRADVVSRFKDSDKFKNAMMDAAADIYEQTLQECRRILRETGRIAEEDLLLMDPNLPTNFNAQGVIEGAADVEDDMEDDISPLS